jgi:hypothetical protein
MKIGNSLPDSRRNQTKRKEDQSSRIRSVEVEIKNIESERFCQEFFRRSQILDRSRLFSSFSIRLARNFLTRDRVEPKIPLEIRAAKMGFGSIGDGLSVKSFTREKKFPLETN